MLSYGQYDTSFDSPRGPLPAGATWSAPENIERSRSDGGTTTVSAWKDLELGAASRNAPFSNYAPFGRSGRFLYGRVSLTF